MMGCCCRSGNNDVVPMDKSGRADKEKPSKATIAGDICHVFGIFFAILVRLILGGFSAFMVWLCVHQTNNEIYYFLNISIGLIIAEGVYTIIKRKGQERKWICLCFIAYLLSAVPPLWILKLDNLDKFDDLYSTVQISGAAAGISANVELDLDTTVAIAEQCLLFLLILGRWLLPRGKITRDQLSQLLFVFIGMACDIMEIFQLFEEQEVSNNRLMSYLVLGVWTLSLFQFSLVLTMSKSPKKHKVATDQKGDGATGDTSSGKVGCLGRLVYTEIWSLIVTCLAQEGPFLFVRTYTIYKYNIVNYSIIFFLCKNVLVVMLLVYRFIVLFVEMANEGGDDDKVELIGGGEDGTPAAPATTGRSQTPATTVATSRDVDVADVEDLDD